MRVSHPIPVALPPYGVLFAESVHATDFQMAQRVDAYHKVFYVLAGRAILEREQSGEEELPAGSVALVPSGTPHRLRDVEPTALLLLCLTEDALRQDPDLPALWSTLTRRSEARLELPRPARERVERMWRRAMLERNHAHLGGDITVRTLAAQLLVLLARQQRATSPDGAQVRVAAVARELRETFYDEWNVDRAAARAGLSRRRFTELFRQTTGHSFADELNALRLAHAARLLEGGDHSIIGVMFSCGFSDVSHFYRLFRAQYGAPPRRWLEERSSRRQGAMGRARRP